MKCDIEPSVHRARATRPGSSRISSRRSGLRASTTSPRSVGGNASTQRRATSLVAPAAPGERVVAQHQVEVVAEHRVGEHVDREARRDPPEALHEPAAAVGVVALVVLVDAAEEGAAHAARHEVVVALVRRDRPADAAGLPCANGPRSGRAAVSPNCHGRRAKQRRRRVRNRPCRSWDGIACVRSSASVVPHVSVVSQNVPELRAYVKQQVDADRQGVVWLLVLRPVRSAVRRRRGVRRRRRRPGLLGAGKTRRWTRL